MNNTTDLNKIKNDPEALDQSIALNRIVIDLLKTRHKEDTTMKALLALSIIVNLIICGIFIAYESQFQTVSTTTTTTEVTQDTGEGEGNNVYQAGENAVYEEDGGDN